MAATEKHFVTFYSPGTFVPEQTSKPIDAWDVRAAQEMADGITERHSAKPCAFVFETRLIHEPIEDGKGGWLKVVPKTIRRSGNVHIRGIVLSLEDVKARNDPKDSILIGNMESNGYAFIVETRNSWKHVTNLNDEDAVTNEAGEIIWRGPKCDWLPVEQPA